MTWTLTIVMPLIVSRIAVSASAASRNSLAGSPALVGLTVLHAFTQPSMSKPLPARVSTSLSLPHVEKRFPCAR